MDAPNVFKVTNNWITTTSVKSFYYFIPNFVQIQYNDLPFSLFILNTLTVNI